MGQFSYLPVRFLIALCSSLTKLSSFICAIQYDEHQTMDESSNRA